MNELNRRRKNVRAWRRFQNKRLSATNNNFTKFPLILNFLDVSIQGMSSCLWPNIDHVCNVFLVFVCYCRWTPQIAERSSGSRREVGNASPTVLSMSPPAFDELTDSGSSGSHFYLCSLPRLILISQYSSTPRPRPHPRSPGMPEFSDRAPCTPGRHGTQAHPRSAPQARKKKKNSTGLETNIPILYIMHGSCPGCHMQWSSITQPAGMWEKTSINDFINYSY